MVMSMMIAVLTTQSKVFWGANLRGDNFIEVFTLLIHFLISIIATNPFLLYEGARGC